MKVWRFLHDAASSASCVREWSPEGGFVGAKYFRGASCVALIDALLVVGPGASSASCVREWSPGGCFVGARCFRGASCVALVDALLDVVLVAALVDVCALVNFWSRLVTCS